MGFEIPTAKNLESKVFNIHNEESCDEVALDLFIYQYSVNQVYQSWCKALGKEPGNVRQLHDIPFLPIRFFKTTEVKAGEFSPEILFRSSGTTSENRSSHYIKDLSLYEKSFLQCFELFYGRPQDYCILGLLPSYLERGESSLVFMVDDLIKKSSHPLSGFYLHNYQQLADTLLQLEKHGQKTILFGVTYALLDFAESFPIPLKKTIIIETGGMKGRKKELTKEELYTALKTAFQLSEIHSEYGMTELLSQAYAINGRYKTPPWMKILLREETDPFSYSNKTGVINIVDLANIYSCSFIATDDLGKLHEDNSFEVLGRIDNSDIRGCSQLAL